MLIKSPYGSVVVNSITMNEFGEEAFTYRENGVSIYFNQKEMVLSYSYLREDGVYESLGSSFDMTDDSVKEKVVSMFNDGSLFKFREIEEINKVFPINREHSVKFVLDTLSNKDKEELLLSILLNQMDKNEKDSE